MGREAPPLQKKMFLGFGAFFILVYLMDDHYPWYESFECIITTAIGCAASIFMMMFPYPMGTSPMLQKKVQQMIVHFGRAQHTLVQAMLSITQEHDSSLGESQEQQVSKLNAQLYTNHASIIPMTPLASVYNSSNNNNSNNTSNISENDSQDSPFIAHFNSIYSHNQPPVQNKQYKNQMKKSDMIASGMYVSAYTRQLLDESNKLQCSINEELMECSVLKDGQYYESWQYRLFVSVFCCAFQRKKTKDAWDNDIADPSYPTFLSAREWYGAPFSIESATQLLSQISTANTTLRSLHDNVRALCSSTTNGLTALYICNKHMDRQLMILNEEVKSFARCFLEKQDIHNDLDAQFTNALICSRTREHTHQFITDYFHGAEYISRVDSSKPSEQVVPIATPAYVFKDLFYKFGLRRNATYSGHVRKGASEVVKAFNSALTVMTPTDNILKEQVPMWLGTVNMTAVPRLELPRGSYTSLLHVLYETWFEYSRIRRRLFKNSQIEQVKLRVSIELAKFRAGLPYSESLLAKFLLDDGCRGCVINSYLHLNMAMTCRVLPSNASRNDKYIKTDCHTFVNITKLDVKNYTLNIYGYLYSPNADSGQLSAELRSVQAARANSGNIDPLHGWSQVNTNVYSGDATLGLPVYTVPLFTSTDWLSLNGFFFDLDQYICRFAHGIVGSVRPSVNKMQCVTSTMPLALHYPDDVYLGYELLVAAKPVELFDPQMSGKTVSEVEVSSPQAAPTPVPDMVLELSSPKSSSPVIASSQTTSSQLTTPLATSTNQEVSIEIGQSLKTDNNDNIDDIMSSIALQKEQSRRDLDVLNIATLADQPGNKANSHWTPFAPPYFPTEKSTSVYISPPPLFTWSLQLEFIPNILVVIIESLIMLADSKTVVPVSENGKPCTECVMTNHSSCTCTITQHVSFSNRLARVLTYLWPGRSSDRSRIRHIFKISLCITIASLFSLVAGPGAIQNPHWAPLTVGFIYSDNVGSGVITAISRLQGTLVGAVYGYLVGSLARYVDEDYGLHFCMVVTCGISLWAFLAGYIRQTTSIVYPSTVSIFTACVIAMGVRSNLPRMAMARIEMTTAGIIIMLLVMSIVMPERAETDALKRITKVLKECMTCLQLTFNMLQLSNKQVKDQESSFTMYGSSLLPGVTNEGVKMGAQLFQTAESNMDVQKLYWQVLHKDKQKSQYRNTTPSVSIPEFRPLDDELLEPTSKTFDAEESRSQFNTMFPTIEIPPSTEEFVIQYNRTVQSTLAVMRTEVAVQNRLQREASAEMSVWNRPDDGSAVIASIIDHQVKLIRLLSRMQQCLYQYHWCSKRIDGKYGISSIVQQYTKKHESTVKNIMTLQAKIYDENSIISNGVNTDLEHEEQDSIPHYSPIHRDTQYLLPSPVTSPYVTSPYASPSTTNPTLDNPQIENFAVLASSACKVLSILIHDVNEQINVSKTASFFSIDCRRPRERRPDRYTTEEQNAQSMFEKNEHARQNVPLDCNCAKIQNNQSKLVFQEPIPNPFENMTDKAEENIEVEFTMKMNQYTYYDSHTEIGSISRRKRQSSGLPADMNAEQHLPSCRYHSRSVTELSKEKVHGLQDWARERVRVKNQFSILTRLVTDYEASSKYRVIGQPPDIVVDAQGQLLPTNSPPMYPMMFMMVENAFMQAIVELTKVLIDLVLAMRSFRLNHMSKKSR